MKRCTKCHVNKDVTEFHANAKAVDGRKSRCRTCSNAASGAWHEANRDKHLAMNHAWYAQNADKSRARTAAWRQENQAAAKSYLAQWREDNAAHVKAQSNLRLAGWKKANKGAVNADTARRYAGKTCATPLWADKLLIRKMYEQAAQMRAAGSDCHVDHIVPIRSKLVCGLHVPANLCIISKLENQLKGNRVWPDQP